MSHIANNIVAQDKTLNQVFTGNRYKIDVFQRDYRWKRDQIDALISDLSSSFMNCYRQGDTLEDVDKYDCYYMGPVVLCQDDGSMSVVDGQQRLTSFTLLFIYLQHQQIELGMEDADDFINMDDYIFVKRGGRKTFVMDVPKRKTVLQMLYDGNIHGIDMSFPEDSEDDRESNINLVSCYDDILHLFPQNLQERYLLPLFVEWLLYKVVIVEIKAFDKDNAYTIFETMNDRGLSLNPTEILKAHILAKITDEDKREEMNVFWKKRVSEIKFIGGNDGDMAFFRAWFRSKYAETFKKAQSGDDMEDFEMIGSRFQTWFKNNQKKLHLNKSEDYYYFVKGDLDFFSLQYMDVLKLSQGGDDVKTDEFYVTACYPMADSLMMPLMIAPIVATDAKNVIYEKMRAVNRYIDLYINRRSFLGKSVNQATIRRRVFEQVKTIRNNNSDELAKNLYRDLYDSSEGSSPLPANINLSQGYSHYALARIWKHLNKELDFSSLLRTRKHTSLVLTQIFTEEEWNRGDITPMNITCWSLTNYCLCRRRDVNNMPLDMEDRIKWLIDNDYLPEMKGIEENTNPFDFLSIRKRRLEELVNEIWSIESLQIWTRSN